MIPSSGLEIQNHACQMACRIEVGIFTVVTSGTDLISMWFTQPPTTYHIEAAYVNLFRRGHPVAPGQVASDWLGGDVACDGREGVDEYAEHLPR